MEADDEDGGGRRWRRSDPGRGRYEGRGSGMLLEEYGLIAGAKVEQAAA
jgi:hypothetical protein